MGGHPVTTTLNRIALVLALALFVALGAYWWRERSREYEAPRWPHASFVPLLSPAEVVPTERWIVAVNPDCGQCTARLAELRRRSAAWTADVTLGALVVDVRRRPDPFVVGDDLGAGVWWDSLGAWRSRWGHRVYGETFVFGPDGALLRLLSVTGKELPAAR